MQAYWKLFTFIFIYFCIDLGCGQFYLGMFKKNDLLVARDIVFKNKTPYGYTYAKYGKVFPCRITYFSVAERVGMGQPPKIKIIRGGLQKNYIVAKMWTYNAPIAVTVLVGCENKNKVHRTFQKSSLKKNGIYIDPSGKTVVLSPNNNTSIDSPDETYYDNPSDINDESYDATDSASNTTDETSESSKAPSTTAEVPSVTTEAPSVTTEAPSVTTKAPSITTKAPSVTTTAPSITTKAPSATTGTP